MTVYVITADGYPELRRGYFVEEGYGQFWVEYFNELNPDITYALVPLKEAP